MSNISVKITTDTPHISHRIRIRSRTRIVVVIATGRRTVTLSQWRVAAAVRSQHLSGMWTVEYALELLLLGGLIPEAAWLAQSLGDWKMAASLGLAYTTYCRLHYDFSR